MPKPRILIARQHLLENTTMLVQEQEINYRKIADNHGIKKKTVIKAFATWFDGDSWVNNEQADIIGYLEPEANCKCLQLLDFRSGQVETIPSLALATYLTANFNLRTQEGITCAAKELSEKQAIKETRRIKGACNEMQRHYGWMAIEKLTDDEIKREAQKIRGIHSQLAYYYGDSYADEWIKEDAERAAIMTRFSGISTREKLKRQQNSGDNGKVLNTFLQDIK